MGIILFISPDTTLFCLVIYVKKTITKTAVE